MKKKVYETMTITPMELEPGCTLLAGSMTAKSIKVNKVEVEDFKAGFGETPGVDDFQEISFD